MYKIIACDLDETLLSDDRTISKENIEAIQKAKELGVKFVSMFIQKIWSMLISMSKKKKIIWQEEWKLQKFLMIILIF